MHLLKKRALVNECILDPPIIVKPPLARAKIETEHTELHCWSYKMCSRATRWVGLDQKTTVIKQLDHTCKHMHLISDANLRKAACTY